MGETGEPSRATSTTDHGLPVDLSGCPSTHSLWSTHQERILSVSRLPHQEVGQLWSIVAPRLPNAIQSLPRDWTAVDRVMKKAKERYAGFQQQNSTAPPLKILVMGGSVTLGVNCRLKGIRSNQCSWPYRLESILNGWLGAPIVEVHVVAAGGTTSATGVQILQDSLLPEAARNPDIVINAYSTNDMHLKGGQLFEATQEFARRVLRSDCGDPPLLLWLDDYIGNEQREILATTQLSQVLDTLSGYYGFASVSYPNMIRDLVYGDTQEYWFSPHGWYKHGSFQREIHPGVYAHLTMAWAVAYSLTNLAVHRCGIEGFASVEVASSTGVPRPTPRGLPPPLTEYLSLETISEQWSSAASERSSCDDRCEFAWLSGIDQNQNDVAFIRDKFAPYTSDGWTLAEKHPKIGFVATDNNPWILDFSSLSQGVTRVGIFYMKSYSHKWTNSTAGVRVQSGDTLVAEATLQGSHDSQTSETYSEILEWDKAVRDVQVHLQRTSGEMLKLMGLVVCRD